MESCRLKGQANAALLKPAQKETAIGSCFPGSWLESVMGKGFAGAAAAFAEVRMKAQVPSWGGRLNYKGVR